MNGETKVTTVKLETIESALRSKRERINDEIRSYPPQIPACDAQFNYLLEQRDRVTVELARLHAIPVETLSTAELADALSEFLGQSLALGTVDVSA